MKKYENFKAALKNLNDMFVRLSQTLEEDWLSCK